MLFFLKNGKMGQQRVMNKGDPPDEVAIFMQIAAQMAQYPGEYVGNRFGGQLQFL